MAGELIFITGATGFIGSATALAALKAGYRLRICLRKPSQDLEALFSEYKEQIEYVTVADLTDESAFSGKLDGADYVLHLASPLPHGTNKDTYFGPAVKGTTAILHEATKVPSIKKVVVTASMASLIPLAGVPVGGVIKEDNDWDFSVDETADFNNPADPAGTAFKLYHASKLLANNAAWEFWKNSKPHYSLVSLHPSFVLGRNLVQTSAKDIEKGSNAGLWKGIMAGVATPMVTGVHIQDVADAQIKALSPSIPDGSKYLISGNKASWKEIAQIVRRDYPNIGAKIATELEIEGESTPMDTSKAEKELGIKWRSLEEMVHDLLDRQLEFSENLN
ncbi:hypothetical protein N7509_003591 [Penicillium cosmopolitanum]|uniref:NAD-dependent epimerase/dehydratase domain-containing protein n=1 Tax=Penicillium cosmopolitanum TaxID=1131564 RepID=A0A9X0BBI5_9EURO|nr:uncharacterized protein N7509_003591 [Penicillium cosmopolitanum]KAJ5403720.1 hypothetical protein N7509_003591 [Penicillium cosmopolitanum]